MGGIGNIVDAQSRRAVRIPPLSLGPVGDEIELFRHQQQITESLEMQRP